MEVVESLSGCHQTLTTVSGRMFKRTVTNNSNGSWIEYTPKPEKPEKPEPATIKRTVSLGWGIAADAVRKGNVVTLSMNRAIHAVDTAENKKLEESIPEGFRPCVQVHLLANKNDGTKFVGVATWHISPNGSMGVTNADSKNAIYIGTITYITEDNYPN